MKNVHLFFLLIFTSIILCNCGEEDCFTPPENIVFEFVNASGENLLQNGTLSQTKIIVQQNEGNGNTTGIKTHLTTDNKIALEGIGWNEGTKKYDVYLNTSIVKIFNFSVISTKINGKCSGYKIDKVQIENITSTKEVGYYRIIVD